MRLSINLNKYQLFLKFQLREFITEKLNITLSKIYQTKEIA